MSVPLPAILVAIVTIPARPALLIISASLLCCLAFNTSCGIFSFFSNFDKYSEFSIEIVPTRHG